MFKLRERQCGDAGEQEAGRNCDVCREQGRHAGLAQTEPRAVLRLVLLLLGVRQLREVEHADRVEHTPAEGAERVGEKKRLITTDFYDSFRFFTVFFFWIFLFSPSERIAAIPCLRTGRSTLTVSNTAS
jgi:hypothetical protein